MKPPKFRYFAPQSVEEALTLLVEHADEARVLAGGQSLVPLMNMRLAHPGVLVDINGISELAYVRPWDGGLALGAMNRDAILERDSTAAARLPLLVEAAHCVGHPAIRNGSTPRGSMASGEAATELGEAMLGRHAKCGVGSGCGRRMVAAED